MIFAPSLTLGSPRRESSLGAIGRNALPMRIGRRLRLRVIYCTHGMFIAALRVSGALLGTPQRRVLE
ncbi:MAG: hypothetical protein ACREDZ_08985 [Kiloniellales bacterium]